MQLLTTLLSALVLAASTTASPAPATKREELIVVTPHIEIPTKGTVWITGSTELVKWDTSDIPPSGQNNTGTILLGYFDGTGSENLDFSKSPMFTVEGVDANIHTLILVTDNPLAHGFPLTAGNQTITVPFVPPRNTYIIARKSFM
jgi:hypothetical protein